MMTQNAAHSTTLRPVLRLAQNQRPPVLTLFSSTSLCCSRKKRTFILYFRKPVERLQTLNNSSDTSRPFFCYFSNWMLTIFSSAELHPSLFLFFQELQLVLKFSVPVCHSLQTHASCSTFAIHQEPPGTPTGSRSNELCSACKQRPGYFLLPSILSGVPSFTFLWSRLEDYRP